jgi:hypothetical protein
VERDLVALATDANRGAAIEAAAPGKPIHLGLGPHAVAERFLVVAEELQATSNAAAAIVSSAVPRTALASRHRIGTVEV